MTVEGYSTQEEIWTGHRWVASTPISTENDADAFNATELRQHVSAFLRGAEQSHPTTLRPRR